MTRAAASWFVSTQRTIKTDCGASFLVEKMPAPCRLSTRVLVGSENCSPSLSLPERMIGMAFKMRLLRRRSVNCCIIVILRHRKKANRKLPLRVAAFCGEFRAYQYLERATCHWCECREDSAYSPGWLEDYFGGELRQAWERRH